MRSLALGLFIVTTISSPSFFVGASVDFHESFFMNWYRKAQLIPASPNSGPRFVEKTVEVPGPLPDEPTPSEPTDFQDVVRKFKHYRIECLSCGEIHQCRCNGPKVDTAVDGCPSCQK